MSNPMFNWIICVQYIFIRAVSFWLEKKCLGVKRSNLTTFFKASPFCNRNEEKNIFSYKTVRLNNRSSRTCFLRCASGFPVRIEAGWKRCSTSTRSTWRTSSARSTSSAPRKTSSTWPRSCRPILQGINFDLFDDSEWVGISGF